MLNKLGEMGILREGGQGDERGLVPLSEVERKVGVSAFARRRLGVVMTRLRMADTVQAVCSVSESLLSNSALGRAKFCQGPKMRQYQSTDNWWNPRPSSS